MKTFFVFLIYVLNVCATNWVEPFIQGEICLKNSEFDKAFNYFQKSIENDRTQAFPYLSLAQVYLHRREFDNAREALENSKNAKEGFDRENVQKYRVLMISLCLSTNDIESYNYYFELFKANSYDVPRTYRENGYIYILNVPNSLRSTIELGIKEYEGSDVNWYGDIGIAKERD